MSGEPAITDEPSVAPSATPVVVPRWIQLVGLPLCVIAFWLVAVAAGRVLLLFLVAAVIALILNPVVSFIERRAHLPRGLAIFAVYLGLFASVGVGGYALAIPVGEQIGEFRSDLPSIIDSANERLADLQEYFDDQGVGLEVKRQGETALETLQDRVLGGTDQLVDFGGEILRTIVEVGFGLILIVVVSVYMLIYARRIGELTRSVFPRGDGTRADDYPSRVQAAAAGYVRGQFLFSTAMGAGAGLGLWLFGALGIFPAGQDYALAFALFFGAMELVPFVGPILGAMPPVLVALFQDPLTAVWVSLLFVGLQQIEGHVVAPLIFGRALRINPLFVIFALLIGGHVYGIVGALIALPLAAIVRETVVYLRRHLVLEPWGDPLRPAAGVGLSDAPAGDHEEPRVASPR